MLTVDFRKGRVASSIIIVFFNFSAMIVLGQTYNFKVNVFNEFEKSLCFHACI